MDDFNEALSIRPNDGAALNARGSFYLAQLKPELAIKDFDKALAASPNDDVLLYNRGMAWKQLNRYDRALRDFNGALRVTPGDPMTLAAKGDAYRQLGDLLLARDFYDAALEGGGGGGRSAESRWRVAGTGAVARIRVASRGGRYQPAASPPGRCGRRGGVKGEGGKGGGGATAGSRRRPTSLIRLLEGGSRLSGLVGSRTLMGGSVLVSSRLEVKVICELVGKVGGGWGGRERKGGREGGRGGGPSG